MKCETQIANAIAKAINEEDHDELERLNVELVYDAESEVLQARQMHSHHVDIYTVTVKYDTTFSG